MSISVAAGVNTGIVPPWLSGAGQAPPVVAQYGDPTHALNTVGALPVTGAELGALVVAGVALVASGWVLRRVNPGETIGPRR